jgi:hypothetical protein
MEDYKRCTLMSKPADRQVTFIVPLHNKLPSPQEDARMSGLAVRYADGGALTTDSPELKLLFADNGYYLNKLPYQIVSAENVDHRSGIGQFTIRRSVNNAVSAANQVCRMYDMMLDGEVVIM